MRETETPFPPYTKISGGNQGYRAFFAVSFFVKNHLLVENQSFPGIMDVPLTVFLFLPLGKGGFDSGPDRRSDPVADGTGKGEFICSGPRLL